jgi:hypothetical protein
MVWRRIIPNAYPNLALPSLVYSLHCQCYTWQTNRSVLKIKDTGTILQHQIPFQVEKTMRRRRWRRERRRRSINILQLFTDRPIIAVK